MDLWTILRDDARRSLMEMEATPTDDENARYRERTFVRTLFAMVEGVCFGMRSLTVQALDSVADADPLPIQIEKQLRDEQKTGRLSGRLPIDEIVTLSFNSICKVLRKNFQLEVQHPGFEALKKAKKTRNKLMHPTKPHEIALLPREILEARQAASWFAVQVERFAGRMK